MAGVAQMHRVALLDRSLVAEDVEERRRARGATRRIDHQLGIQHGLLTRVAVDHPGARDPMGPVGYWLDDIMSVQDSHILDGADSSPDMGLQKWSAGLI